MRVLHFLYQAVGIEMYFWNLLKKSFLVGLFSCKNGNLKAQIHTKITNKQIMMQTELGKKACNIFTTIDYLFMQLHLHALRWNFVGRFISSVLKSKM